MQEKGFGLAFGAGEVDVGESKVEVGLFVGKGAVLDKFFAFEDVGHPSFDFVLTCQNSNFAVVGVHEQFEDRLAVFYFEFAGGVVLEFPFQNGVGRNQS